MNRTIKFRGKDRDIDQWVYGCYVYGIGLSDEPIHQIEIADANDYRLYNIIPETVGQYTGMNDKNGKEIYEADIRKFKNGIGIVVWDDAAFAIKSPGSEAIDWEHSSVFIDSEYMGNIYEHPTLLLPTYIATPDTINGRTVAIVEAVRGSELP